MASSNVAWGIEIGAGAIKGLKLERSGEGVNVLDYAVVQHKKVLSTPELNQSDAIRVALGEFVNQYDLSGASVAVSIPGHSSFARFAKLPPVEPKKVKDIVKFEAVQQIPFPIEDVEWAYQTFKSPDSPDIEVGIFAVTRDRVNEKLQQLEDVGIVPDLVTVGPVAVYNALAYDLAFTEQTPGTIILDIGTTSTDLIVAEAGRVWIRTFPIGGHHFTAALVDKFQLTYPKAEKLKREAESSKHARHIFQALRPVFADLAQDAQRSIGYYQSLHRDAKLVRLIGLGSTVRLPGMRKFLKQQLGLDVYRLEQFKRAVMDGPRAGELQAVSVNMATCYGLALQTLGLAPISDANLMPVPVIRAAMWKRKTKWFAAAAGISVVAGGAMFIRPFLDQQAIGAVPRPTIIDTVASEATRLRNDASDVTGAGTPDFKAASMVGLVTNEPIFEHIVNDVGLIFEDAERVRAAMPAPAAPAAPAASAAAPAAAPAPDVRVIENAPAFTLMSLTTTYLAPSATAPADDGSGSGGGGDFGGDSRGGKSGGGRDFGGAPQPASTTDSGSSAPEDPAIVPFQRVRVEMIVQTSVPDAQRLMINSVQRWLKENAKREGIPYQIAAGEPSWQQISREIVRVETDGSRPGAGGEVSGEIASPRGGRGRAMQPAAAPGAGIVGDSGSGPVRIPTEEEAAETLMGANAAQRAAEGARRVREISMAVLNERAPLPPDPLPAPVGATVVTYKITWTAVIKPPAPPAEGEIGGETGGAR